MWKDTKEVGYSMMRHTWYKRWMIKLVLQEIMSHFKFLVSLILIALSTHCAANELGGFGESCKDTYLENNVLYSTCQSTDSSDNWTYIELDQCLVNTNGNLYCSVK